MIRRARSSPLVGATALAVAAVLVAGCSSTDDSVAGSPTSRAPLTATVPPAGDVVVSPPPVATRPGAPQTSTDASGSTSGNGATSVAGTTAGGYRPVGPEALLHLDPDGITHPIDDPLADGIYYASTYELAADGSGIAFNLARFSSTEACIAALGTVPEGTINQQGCYGGTVDTSATATVTLRFDHEVPVILVSADFKFLEVTAEEFARLLRGEPPAPDAPTWFEYQPYWDALVEVGGGTVTRANQRPSS